MDKKVLGGGAIVAIAVLGAAVLTTTPLIPIAVAVVGLLALVVVLRRTGQDTPARPRREHGRKRGRKARADGDAGTDGDGSGQGRRTRTTARSEEALPTWGGLPAWTPSQLDELADTSTDDETGSGTAVAEPAEEAEESSWEAWEREWETDTPDAPELEEAVADDEVIGSFEVELDTLDEELEQVFAEEIPEDEGPTLYVDEVVIDENVSSADDIMAASAATELHVDDNAGADSELAKLLAKVQARLAAYE
ncbi:MAG: hypothetical protein MUF83_02555 [Acidimicrobiales bacterium]|jgi:hypothetical protein|nr:hypothetical protein [Acidimicrobiales bacterium]